MALTPQPFTTEFSPAAIADLRGRLVATRWPDQPAGSGWRYGTDGDVLRDLCEYWARDYDWIAGHTRLNRHPQFTANIHGRQIHFYHVRSSAPGARAVMLCHGWPGASAEFLDVIGPLAEPASHGTPDAEPFDVIVPSLPGFGFSGPVAAGGYRARDIAADFAALMAGLGHDRYLIHGGDKGTRVAMTIAADHPDRVAGLHLGLMPAPPPDPANRLGGLDAADIERVRRTDDFLATQMAYQAVQRTTPQSLAYGLMDSPAGLAGWLIDKYRAWTDCGGDLDAAFPRDRLVDLLNIYWFTGTIASSMRSYFEDGAPGLHEPLPTVTVPVGHSVYPAEIIHTPRPWAEQTFDIRYWQDVPRGGHFPALEVPEDFVGEIRACFRLIS